MPFNQLPQPRYQPGPQAPTENGYQAAGGAMQQLGEIGGQYASIFEKMVEDRKAAILAQNAQIVKEKKDQLYFDEAERKKTEREELKKETDKQEANDKSFLDRALKLDRDSPTYQEDLKREYLINKNISPDEYYKLETAPKKLTFEEKQDILHGNRLKEISARGVRDKKTNSNKDRYKGFNRNEVNMLKAVDDGSVPLESQLENARYIIEELNIKALELEGIGSKVSEERSKRVRKKQYAAEEFLRTLEKWQPESKSTGKVSPEIQQNIQLFNEHIDKLNPQQQAVLKAINENPSDPRVSAALSKLKSELENGLNP